MYNHETFLYRTVQAIWYLFSIVETLLLVRFVLKLFGANPEAAFTHVIYSISQVLITPFQFVFGTPSAGIGVIDMSALLALIAYWFLAWGLVSLIAMNRTVDEKEASQNLRTQDSHI